MQVAGNSFPSKTVLRPNLGCLAAATSSILLSVSHSHWGGGFWALGALIPLLYASAQAPRLRYVVVYGFIASIGPSSLMFESIMTSHTPAAILALLSQAPQFILPLVTWFVLRHKHNSSVAIVSFCILWMVIEQLRMHPIMSGHYASFYSIAYSQVDTGLLFPAQAGGTLTTTLLLLAVNSIATRHLLRRNAASLLPLTLLALPINLGTDYAPDTDAGAITVLAVQTAWTAAEQFQMMDSTNNIQRLEELTYWASHNEDQIQHIFLPETILSGLSEVDQMAELMVASDASLIAGVSMRDHVRPANNLFLIDSDGSTHLYDKWQLVPAYETPVFKPGNHVATLQIGDYLNIGFLICMDGTNEWLIKQSVEAGANVIVVVSASDYGSGYSTPELHLQLVRAQAQIFRIPILFLASNGPSAFVTPDGNVRERVDEGIQSALRLDLTNWSKVSSSEPHLIVLIKFLSIALSMIPVFKHRTRVS